VCAWPSVRLSVPLGLVYALVPGGFRVDSLLATLVAFCSARRLAAAARRFAHFPRRSVTMGSPSSPISQGRAAAVLVKTLRTVKARMGERSMVPPMGGMMPRKRFR